MVSPVVAADAPCVAPLARARVLLATLTRCNPFYAKKFRDVREDDFGRLPFTTKAELIADQAICPPYGSNLTFPLERYTRFHQTSGTSTGRPLFWLDTPESWEWLLGCWQAYFALIGLRPGDRLFFPFSFGPFLGFWSAFDAAARAGWLCIPGGGMSSTARLRCLTEHRCTILFATPTYALHLAECAAKEGIDIAGGPVRAIVVAGEPGGAIPATRQRIENLWGARVFDHYGLTEVGPVAIEAADVPNQMYLNESEYIAEVVSPQTGQAVGDGEIGELVLTNLGRTGSPLIRYRTGDLVRLATDPDPTGRTWRRLEGGILGRVDDMIHIRGNNIYPGAIEAIIRQFPEVAEFRICVENRGSLTDLRLEIEPTSGDGHSVAKAIARAVRDALLLRVEVAAVAPGSLPRFEMKARRLVRNEK